MRRIVAGVEIGNESSVRVLEKLGLQRAGIEPGPRRSFYAYELDRPTGP